MRILLVEDRPNTAYVTSRLLRGHGHSVQVADSVESAKALCAQSTFDLLICDIRLPDGDGWELMAYLRRTCHVKGIALSSSAFSDDVNHSLRAGFDAHLQKPIDFMHLMSTMNEIEAAAT